MSLTHGIRSQRSHIWTFTVGVAEDVQRLLSSSCPCDTLHTNIYIFVEYFHHLWAMTIYFCESGVHNAAPLDGVPFGDDPLWDGNVTYLNPNVVSSTTLHGSQRTYSTLL